MDVTYLIKVTAYKMEVTFYVKFYCPSTCLQC